MPGLQSIAKPLTAVMHHFAGVEGQRAALDAAAHC